MELRDKVAVVTGGGNGIGRALCRRFAAEGVRGIVVADLDQAAAEAVAREVGGLAVACDVANEQDVVRLVETTLESYKCVDLFCSNAGITTAGGIEVANDQWQRMWDVNVMAHVYTARAVLPAMVQRGSGYLLQTASAAGLLTEMGSAVYSVTKHAAVAFAEWLAIRYHDLGIGVSCLCPMGVSTAMLESEDPHVRYLRLTAVEPEDVAEAVVAGLREEQFLILPHAQVADFFRYKAEDRERWMRGMRRLHQKLSGGKPANPRRRDQKEQGRA